MNTACTRDILPARGCGEFVAVMARPNSFRATSGELKSAIAARDRHGNPQTTDGVDATASTH